MNGERISVGQQETIGDAIVAMGSPPGVESMEMSLRGIAALMRKVRTIRMLGSAALMLAWVANGRLTCYWEYDLSSWDSKFSQTTMASASPIIPNSPKTTSYLLRSCCWSTIDYRSWWKIY